MQELPVGFHLAKSDSRFTKEEVCSIFQVTPTKLEYAIRAKKFPNGEVVRSGLSVRGNCGRGKRFWRKSLLMSVFLGSWVKIYDR